MNKQKTPITLLILYTVSILLYKANIDLYMLLCIMVCIVVGCLMLLIDKDNLH